MKLIAHAFVLALSIEWSSLVYAKTNDSAHCRPQSFKELILCAEKNSADIRMQEQQLKSAQMLEGIAQQKMNPEIDADYLSKGSEKSEFNAALMFTLRLGAKKTALFSEARNEVTKAETQFELSVQQIRLEFMLSAYRLSHLNSEIDLENESVTTFSKIVQQFQKRLALSPEQAISLSIFKMALADHQLRLAKLKTDQKKLIQTLTVVAGVSQPELEKNLPPRKGQWPQLTALKDVDEAPQMRRATFDLKQAQNQKTKSDSDAWPDIKIGPSLRTTREFGESETFVGFGLSMPLPVFSLNGATRAHHAQKVAEAEIAKEQARLAIIAKKEELINRYNQMVLGLKSTLSAKALNEQHTQIERQFFKGLVSSSLVIEAHRQLYDLEERRNASELDALEAYGQLLILENRFAEVIL